MENTIKKNPLTLINLIKESTPDAEKIYTCGGCFHLYLILREVYPEAEAYYDGNHVYTKIDNTYYDITGKHINPPNVYKLSTEPRIFKSAFKWLESAKSNWRNINFSA